MDLFECLLRLPSIHYTDCLVCETGFAFADPYPYQKIHRITVAGFTTTMTSRHRGHSR
jgi:hypothetical protein